MMSAPGEGFLPRVRFEEAPMKKADMNRLHGQGETHDCCPKYWRDVPVLSGDYDLDATIEHRDNTDLPKRLALYTKHNGAYGHRSAYNGYGNYGGDT